MISPPPSPPLKELEDRDVLFLRTGVVRPPGSRGGGEGGRRATKLQGGREGLEISILEKDIRYGIGGMQDTAFSYS